MKLLPLILIAAGAVTAQSSRKDIPAIAKAANGTVVSILMSDKDGHVVAQGSGFLVSKDGLIVTNYHVIAEGSSAIVKLPDGATYVVDGMAASDKARDVAVVKAHGKNFLTLSLGNSDRLQIGEGVVAIGNPLSLESTVSNGIVSGIRTIEQKGGKFLQVTTPISPGSSGGPLFNMAGEVVGITTMYLEGGENLNFAIPINDAKPLLLTNSSRLQKLPDEHESVVSDESPAPISDELTAQTNAPAYQSFLALLKSEDLTFKVSTYVCFDDDPGSKTFMVIDARLLNKQTMMVMTQNFTSGVSNEPNGIFVGPLTPFSGEHGLFATLHTKIDYRDFPSHQTDSFEWGPEVLTMKAGFGELSPGQVRTTYEFNMQRSTGRYTERNDFQGVGSDAFTVTKTGKCARIPNTQTPEEAYRSLK